MPRRSTDVGDRDLGVQAAPGERLLPWSITLPVAAGVFLGALLLGLLLLAYWQGQARATTESGEGRTRTSGSSPPVAIAQQPDTTATRRSGETEQALPRLPGLIEANRRQLRTACIAGTVGHRQKNGWTQAIARNAPRRCVATSQ